MSIDHQQIVDINLHWKSFYSTGMDTNDAFGSSQASEHSLFPKSIYLLFISLIAILITSPRWKFCFQLFLPHEQATKQNTRTPPSVPFIIIRKEGDKHPSRIIHQSLEKYKTDAHQALRGLSQQIEQAIELEHGLDIPQAAKLSAKIHVRIEKLSTIFNRNENTIQNLLDSGDFITSLPDHPVNNAEEDSLKRNSHGCAETGQQTNVDSLNFHPSTVLHSSKRNASQLLLEENVYDMTAQIVAHLVRDWSTAGSQIRESLYGWVCQELAQRQSWNNRKDPVLVPGAGMGRLAYDIHSNGFTVEANEISPVMAAAAKSIITKNASGTIYPYAMDAMTNEVDSSRRYDAVTFPDTPVEQITSSEVSLSFTIGDFVGTYYSQQISAFGSVVTCFFIDTATDIYDYITLIKRLLKPRGIWINVGPVQWHANALLRPSVDELKDLILHFGFQIATWSVDEKPVPYRQDVNSFGGSSFVRSTNFDAYRPLRFVAIRQ